MSFKRVLFFFIVSFLCQLSLAGIFNIGNMGPNLIMCSMVIITFLYEDGYRSIPFALLAGLLLDICSSEFVGITPLVLLFTGIFVAAARVWLNTEKIYTLITTSVIATIIYYTLYFAAYKILGTPQGVLHLLGQEPVFILYNLAVTTIMFLVMHKRAEKYHNDRYDL